MFRLATGSSRSVLQSFRSKIGYGIGNLRLYGGGGIDDSSRTQQQRQTVQQIIQYSLGLARSQKSADSYAQALLVLEQGFSNLRSADDEASDDAAGMFLIAMSTLHHESEELNEAVEKLQMIHRLKHCTPCARVAAWEGLVGLKLEYGEDDSSLAFADECLQLLRYRREENAPIINPLYHRCKAVRGLVDLVRGDIQSAEMNFRGCDDCESSDEKYRCGNFALSCGEFLHATGNFSLAREFYERALQVSELDNEMELYSMSSANMVPPEVSLSATCAMGQLLMHSKDFQGAENFLTKALNKAEDIFGTNHPKVGVVLTCIAMMYGQKARMEHSSSLLIQEGLYRRAIDYLKAQPLTGENDDLQRDQRRRDILALARGGYADILSIQQSRKEEGERLRRMAESRWMNSRLSLAQALSAADPATHAIIDTRISRVL